MGVAQPKATKKKLHVLLAGDGEALASELKGALRQRKLKVTRERRDGVVERAQKGAPDMIVLMGDAAEDGGSDIALRLAAAEVDTRLVVLAGEGRRLSQTGDALVQLVRESPYQIAEQVSEMLERRSRRDDGRVTDPFLMERLRRQSMPANDPGATAPHKVDIPAQPPVTGVDAFGEEAVTGRQPFDEDEELDTIKPPADMPNTPDSGAPKGLWSQPPQQPPLSPAAVPQEIPDATPTAAWGPSERAQALEALEEQYGEEEDTDSTAAYGPEDRARALAALEAAADEEIVPAPEGAPPPEDPMTHSGEEAIVPHPDSGEISLGPEIPGRETMEAVELLESGAPKGTFSSAPPPPEQPAADEPAAEQPADEPAPAQAEADTAEPEADIPELDALDAAMGMGDASTENDFFEDDKPAGGPGFNLDDLIPKVSDPPAAPPRKKSRWKLRVSQAVFLASLGLVAYVFVVRVLPALQAGQ